MNGSVRGGAERRDVDLTGENRSLGSFDGMGSCFEGVLIAIAPGISTSSSSSCDVVAAGATVAFSNEDNEG